jgi:hypothetical protein
MPLITFTDAIADSSAYSKRHLLLGNGFSIACRADIFHYGSLFAQADFSQIPEVQGAFEALGTQDFEVAIHSLESAARILPAYVALGGAAATKMLEHAAALKEILVETIAANHPNIPPDVPDEKFWACRQFLAHFLSGRQAGKVFTLNYDLLLYWALMHDDNPFGERLQLAANDGFGNDEDSPDADYVVWQGETKAHDARVHFLHGALHLFDSGAELKKYTWIRKKVPLVDQARTAIGDDSYPLFVAEGTSARKKEKIRHNAYLYQGFKEFVSNLKISTHCMFVFGHSFAENDDHVLVRIGRARIPKIYVGIYGDPNTPENQRVMSRAQALTTTRDEKFPLTVIFFDAVSANVWGG